MDRERAKRILECHKGPAINGDDGEMAEALALLQRDTELRAWFEQKQQWDGLLRRKLRAMPPPPDLLESVLAGFPEEAAGQRTSRRWIQPLAIAAMIAVLLGVGWMIWQSSTQPQAQSLAAFRADMGSFLKTFPRLDVYTEKTSAVKEWLGAKPRFAGAQLPATLDRFPAIGCRELIWQGQQAALVCFMVDGEIVHVFVLPKQPWTETGKAGAPVYGPAGKFASATWAQGEFTFVAISTGSAAFLKARFGG